MAYELGRDVLRASQLVGELQASEAGLRENEERLSLAVDAANFGIWIRDLARNEIWASDKWRKLFGFAPSERLELDAILQRLHPDDREGFQQTVGAAVGGEGRYGAEFRVMLPNGGIRWISSHGRVEFDVNGQPVRIRGASRDVTADRQAELETQHCPLLGIDPRATHHVYAANGASEAQGFVRIWLAGDPLR
jgi:PAS domain S-box-containing protein